MSNKAIVQSYAETLLTQDVKASVALLHPEFIGKFPQSGELIRGPENFEAIAVNYPINLPESDSFETVGDEKQKAHVQSTTFGMPLITVTGGGDTFTLTSLARYPNGDEYHMVAIIELKDGLIFRETDYWAAPFPPPEWRSDFVEMTADGE